MGNMSKNVREKIYKVTSGRCFYCGCKLSFDNFQVDHFKPKAHGGIDKNNRVPCCSDCNSIKGKKSVEEFRKTIYGYFSDDIHVRMINKYYILPKREPTFYFEKNNFTPV